MIRARTISYPSSAVLRSRAAIVVYILVLWSLHTGILALALPLYITSLGRSASDWGLLSGVFAFGFIFAEPTWGWLSDRIGIVRPILISRFFSTLVVLVFALTQNPAAFLLVQAARGVFEVVMGPLGRKVLAHSVGHGKKALGMSLFQGTLTIGGGVGALIGGAIVSQWGYAAAFVTCSILSGLSFLLTLVCRAQLRDPIESGQTTAADDAAIAVRGSRDGNHFLVAFSFLAIIAVCLFVGSTTSRAFLPLLASSVAGLPASQVAQLLTLTSVLGGVFMILLGRIADRFRREQLIVVGLILMSVALMAYGYSRSFAAIAVFALLNFLGMAVAVPSGVAVVSDIAPRSRQGQMIGLYGSFEDLGMMLGPVICGYLWDLSGPQVAFAVCGAITAAGILAVAALRPRLARRAEDINDP